MNWNGFAIGFIIASYCIAALSLAIIGAVTDNSATLSVGTTMLGTALGSIATIAAISNSTINNKIKQFFRRTS